ncbi:hypothetical protein K2X85_02620 [bacterium]|nr:hypothetical protein [bacterium]
MNRYGLWMIGLVGTLGVMGMTSLFAADADPNESLRQATEALALQNYNEARALAQNVIDQKATDDLTDRASDVLGQAEAGLGNPTAAFELLHALVQRRPAYAQKKETMNRLALAARNVAPPAIAIKYFEQAIALHQAANDTKSQIELLFSLAQYYRHQQHLRDSGRSDWQANQLDGALRALTTLDRVLASKASMDDQVLALRQKTEIVLQSAQPMISMPKVALPADLPLLEGSDKPFDLAIRFQQEIVQRFPDQPVAAEAMIQIAQIQSNYKQDFVGAVATAKEVIARFGRLKDPVRDAGFIIESITTPQLSIMPTGQARPGEKVKFQWNARNMAVIDLQAYPLDLMEIMRKESDSPDLASAVQRAKPKGEPIARWSIETGDLGTHQLLSSKENAAESPLQESNAYLIVAKGRGTSTSAQAIAVVSRLAMVMKTGKTKANFYVVDINTGKPIPQTELLVRRYLRTVQRPALPIPGMGPNVSKQEFEIIEQTVPDSGLAEIKIGDNPKSDNRESHQILGIARVGKDYAGTFSSSWFGWWGWNNGAYGYVYTDRPVYRPQQVVNFRMMLRQYIDGTFSLEANQKVMVSIIDAKGESVYSKEHLTTDQGTLSGSFTLGEEPALGTYSLQVANAQGGINLNPGTQFRVEEYKKPEFQVTVEADKPFHKLGDKMAVKVHGEFYFGGPVASAKVTYTVHRESIPWFYPWVGPYDWFYRDGEGHHGRFWNVQPHRQDLITQGELTTDALGNALINIATEPFPNDPLLDVQYRIDVNMVDSSRREIRASQTIKVTKRAFTISIEPMKQIYQPGDTVKLQVKSQNANSQPVSFKGTRTVSLVTQRETRNSAGQIDKKEETRPIEQKPIDIGNRGEGEFSFVADQEGLFKIVVESPDPFTDGETIVGTTYVWVAKAGGAFAHYANRDIEIVLEQDTYRAGESAKILLNCRQPGSYVLLTADGDDIYRSQVIYVEGTQAVVDWKIERTFRPSVRIHATTISSNKIFQDSTTMRVPPVEQFLTVKIRAPKEEFRPREEATIDVEVLDHEGKPATDVELSLGGFDASILYIQPEMRGDIRQYFHGRQRPVTVNDTSSFIFWPNQSLFPQSRRRFAAGGGFGGGGMPMMADGSMPMPMSAPMSKAMPRKEAANVAEAKDEFATTDTRTDFRDSLFWAAHLKTDTAGRASATIKFPDSLTLWRLTAIGGDKETRVGEVIHEVRTKKNILVRLEMPRFLVQYDKFVASAIAHNYFAEPRKVRIDLTQTKGLDLLAVNATTWATGEAVRPIAGETAFVDVEIPAVGEKRIDFVLTSSQPGTVSVTARALSTGESDAMTLQIPCYEYGAEKLLAESGIIFGNNSVRQSIARLTIPKEIRRGSASLTVRFSPTAAAVMLESLPYLAQYPYGCVEQTMSRFLPTVLTARTLEELDLKPSDLAKLPTNDAVKQRLQKWHSNPVFDDAELSRMIRAGVARLADFQHEDGGWGWWKQDDSNPYMTAYVVSGLHLAREAKVALPNGMLDRGVEFLAGRAAQIEPIRQYPWMQGEDFSLRAYMHYAIGQANPSRLRSPELHASLKKLFSKRDSLSDYARALLAVALADADLREESQIVLSNVKDRVILSKETNTASWGKSAGYYYWHEAGTEATSYSLKALLRLEPTSPLIPQAVQWLVRQRQGTRWFNTKDTAIACYALADYLRATGELNPDLTIIVDIDGKEVRRSRVTRENLFTFDDELRIVAEELGTGTKEISIRTEGKGNCYWGAYATFFSQESEITSAGHEIYVTRKYEKLTPRKVMKTRTVFDANEGKQKEERYEAIEYDRAPVSKGDSLQSGDLVEVTLDIDARNNFEYVLFEDPKPAGCEPTELQSGYRWGNGMGSHTELRDEKVAFFASYLPQGKHAISYQLRAEIPGEFSALPAFGECMYTPFVRGNSASQRIRIVDKQ